MVNNGHEVWVALGSEAAAGHFLGSSREDIGWSTWTSWGGRSWRSADLLMVVMFSITINISIPSIMRFLIWLADGSKSLSTINSMSHH